MGKARAALFTVQKVSFLPHTEVIFEGDSKLVIDAISSDGQQSDWRIRSLIADIVKFCCDHCGWSLSMLSTKLILLPIIWLNGR